ncbi:hypothetical protein CPC08DRAFT_749265 [Agrocybe pediades]|nr:hypothetical protein CPC08DRAFT_749265 [Agrocybe pediades]
MTPVVCRRNSTTLESGWILEEHWKILTLVIWKVLRLELHYIEDRLVGGRKAGSVLHCRVENHGKSANLFLHESKQAEAKEALSRTSGGHQLGCTAFPPHLETCLSATAFRWGKNTCYRKVSKLRRGAEIVPTRSPSLSLRLVQNCLLRKTVLVSRSWAKTPNDKCRSIFEKAYEASPNGFGVVDSPAGITGYMIVVQISQKLLFHVNASMSRIPSIDSNAV